MIEVTGTLIQDAMFHRLGAVEGANSAAILFLMRTTQDRGLPIQVSLVKSGSELQLIRLQERSFAYRKNHHMKAIGEYIDYVSDHGIARLVLRSVRWILCNDDRLL